MIFEAIKNLIAERNDCEPESITMESSFKELGIDSLDTVEMLMSLEEVVGREIEVDKRLETVGELVQYIQEKYNIA